MEHRWGRRIAVDMPIRIAVAGSPCKAGRLSNLSITGALIKADFRLRVLSLVIIVIDSSKDSDASRIAGYVARLDRHGMGVEWCAIAAPAVIDLVRMSTGGSLRQLETLEQGH